MVMPDPFMSQAIALAIENARSGGGPFAALIVKDEQVLASGTNQVTASNDPTAHAEIVAIRAACAVLGLFQLEGCDLYTTCEPCPMCLGAIYWARPTRVFYAATAADAADAGFDDAFIYEQLHIAPADRKIPFAQLMREQALTAFQAWKDNPWRVSY